MKEAKDSGWISAPLRAPEILVHQIGAFTLLRRSVVRVHV